MRTAIGRQIHYTLTAADVRAIESRRDRTTVAGDKERLPRGAQGHKGNPVYEGQVVFGFITAVWAANLVNARVLLDGNDDHWLLSIEIADRPEPGKAHWWDWEAQQAPQGEASESAPVGYASDRLAKTEAATRAWEVGDKVRLIAHNEAGEVVTVHGDGTVDVQWPYGGVSSHHPDELVDADDAKDYTAPSSTADYKVAVDPDPAAPATVTDQAAKEAGSTEQGDPEGNAASGPAEGGEDKPKKGKKH